MHPEKDVDPPKSSSPRWFLIVLVVIAAFLAFVAVVRRGGERKSKPVGINHPAVGRQLSLLNVEPLLNTEEPIALNDLRGQVTLVNYWGPWCPPCLMEMPELLQLEKKYRGQEGVRVVLVSSTGGHGMTLEELESDSLSVLRKHKADPPIYQDEDADTLQAIVQAAELPGFTFPTTVLLDGEGKILALWTGYRADFVEEMGDAIEQQMNDEGPMTNDQ